MSDDPFTPAELEAGAAAVREHIETGLARLPAGELSPSGVAAAVLAAVLPLHAARVRAETAYAIGERCTREMHGQPEQFQLGLHRAREIARAHATTPTEGDDHG